MRRKIGLFIGVLFLLSAGVFAVYVSSVERVCDRIERVTEIVKWGSNAVKFTIAPWVHESTLSKAHTEGVYMRLRFARFLQAYNGYVACPWDRAIQQMRPEAERMR